MSESNRTAIRVTKETSYRVLPETPHYQELRFNSDTLAYTPTTETSNEIDSSRQVKDLILTGYDAAGDIVTEYSIENLDPILEGALANTWLRTPEVYNGPGWEYAATATRISGVTFATSTATFTTAASSVLNGSAINATGAAFKVGMLVRATGFSTAANIGLFPVTASTATTVAVTGGAAEASPPVGARLKVVGAQGASGDITAVTAGGNALVTTTLDWTTMGLIVGQWVKISSEGGNYSFATSGCNVYARISAISATRLSFDVVTGSSWAADTGTSKTIRVYWGDTIRNGVTPASYRIEKSYVLDAGQRYAYYRGMQVGTIAVSAETRAVVTATVSWTGSDSTPMSPTRDSGAVTLASPAGTVLDSSNSVPLLLEAGTTLASPNYVSSFSFTLENNLRAQSAVGTAGAVGIGMGRSVFTGNLNTYFGDETILTKLINNTASSVTITLRDQATFKSDLWDVPRLKYSSGTPETTGVDTDIFSNLAFQGLRDVLNNRDYTVMLNHFDYVI